MMYKWKNTNLYAFSSLLHVTSFRCTFTFSFVLFKKYNSILHVKSVVSLLGLPFYVSSCLAAFCRLVDVEGYAGLLRWTWLRE